MEETRHGVRQNLFSFVLKRGFFDVPQALSIAAALVLVIVGGTVYYIYSYLPNIQVLYARPDEVRFWLLSSRSVPDFVYVNTLPGWDFYPTHVLVEDCSIAERDKNRFYTELSDEIYEPYLLSPVIGPGQTRDFGWRASLHKQLLPLLRTTTEPSQAAQAVAYRLTLTIGIDSACSDYAPVDTMLTERLASRRGWQRLLVAAYRSIGLPARLDDHWQAQYWASGAWRNAPAEFNSGHNM